MKKFIFTIILCIASSSLSFAEPFAPTLLKIDADVIINYDFSGSEIEIPVTVSGTPCQLIFCLFTKDRGYEMGLVQNGFLGWHQINSIDTCIYASAPQQMYPGENIITWDGRQNDGCFVPMGMYSYYMWAYDNISEKQLACRFIETHQSIWSTDMSVQEVDESGLPLDNPFWYRADERWYLGSDPEDELMLQKSELRLEDGWSWQGKPALDYYDMNYLYIRVSNAETKKGSLQKIKFIPGGVAEIQADWGGDAPYADIIDTYVRSSPGVLNDDNNYLYTIDDYTISSNFANSDLFIYDTDGSKITKIDLTQWWSSPGVLDLGAQMNGGPNSFSLRENRIFLNSFSSCLKQMIDPLEYLESGIVDDMLIWSNGNGDYFFDKNFEDWAELKWICNDFNVGPYSYDACIDDNLFVMSIVDNRTSNYFGLFAPDGTGLGYHPFKDDGHFDKKGLFVVDSGSPFDGIYCDNMSWKGPHISMTMDYVEKFLGGYYVGHDSINGLLGCTCDYVSNMKHVHIAYPKKETRLIATSNECIVIDSWLISHVTIEFSSNGGDTWVSLIENKEVQDYQNTLAWTIPDVISDSCLIRIYDTDEPEISYTTDPFSIATDDIILDVASQPLAFTLSQNSPNPFNPVTLIPFTLPKESAVTLTVYNIAGEKVTELVNTTLSAGKHSVDWDASGVGSGMYFARLRAGEFVETVKMMVVK